MAAETFKLSDVDFVLKALSIPDLTNAKNPQYNQTDIVNLCEKLLDLGFLKRSTRFNLQGRNILAYELSPRGEDLLYNLGDDEIYEAYRFLYNNELSAAVLESVLTTTKKDLKARIRERKDLGSAETEAKETKTQLEELSDRTGIEHIPAGQEEWNAAAQIPNPVHDAAYVWGSAYHESRPDFTFWLRRRNRNNRLREGFWFQGTNNYASMGLYNLRSNNLSTKSIAIVFWPNKEEIAASFEVIFQGNQSENLLIFYQAIRKLLEDEDSFETRLEERGGRRFRMTLAYTNPFDEVERFLNTYLERLNALVRRFSLEDGVIGQEEFQNSLDRIIHIRNLITNAGNSFSEVSEAVPEESPAPNEYDDEGVDQELDKDYNESRSGSIQQTEYLMTIMGSTQMVMLDIDKIAKTFTDVIIRTINRKEQDKQETSLTQEEDHFFGIFGRWGRGKTHFWEQIKEYINDTPHLKTQFVTKSIHAWKYQETPATWAYIYEEIARMYYREAKDWYREPFAALQNIWRSIRLNFFRDTNQVLLAAAGVLGLVGTTIYSSWQVCTISGFAGYMSASGVLPYFNVAFLLSLIGAAYKFLKNPIMTKAHAFVVKYGKRHTYKDRLGLQHEIQIELIHLLNAWKSLHRRKKKKIILFIDDIDRCSQDKIITIIDSLRVMLNEPKVSEHMVVLAAIDQRILLKAIEKKYEDFGYGDKHLEDMSYEYIDKIFIVGIKLEELNGDRVDHVFDKFLGIEPETVEEPQHDQSSDEIDDSQPGDDISEGDDHDEANKEEKISTKPPTKGTDNGEPASENNDQEAPPEDANSLSEDDHDNANQYDKKEKELVKSYGLNLKKPTPRSIRNYTIKYRLARALVLAQIKDKPDLMDHWLEVDNAGKRRACELIVAKMNRSYRPAMRIDVEDLNPYIERAVEMVTYYEEEQIVNRKGRSANDTEAREGNDKEEGKS